MCRSILISDDQPSISALIQRYLMEHEESRDSTVTYCPTMDSVWAFFEGGGHADIVFLDLVQSPFTATDIISFIPRLVKLCPTVIVVSGFPQYREPSLAAGATDFLSKLGDLDTPMSFFEKVAKYFREASGPSVADKSLANLSKILRPDAP
jgi:DNA-binding NtrC family response regulator